MTLAEEQRNHQAKVKQDLHSRLSLRSLWPDFAWFAPWARLALWLWRTDGPSAARR